MFDRLGRRAALILIAVVALIVAHPVIWAAGWVKPETNMDSFPLSTFPMFAERVDNQKFMNYVVISGGPNDGAIVSWWLWTKGGMNGARGQINHAFREFRDRGTDEKLKGFCRTAADRIARETKGTEPYQGAREIRVVRSRVLVDRYFEGSERPKLKRRVLTRCPVVPAPEGKEGSKPG